MNPWMIRLERFSFRYRKSFKMKMVNSPLKRKSRRLLPWVIHFAVVCACAPYFIRKDRQFFCNASTAHTQVKNSVQLYSKLLIRALSHQDSRMRLAAMIAIAETAIDNLSFQMKVIVNLLIVLLNSIVQLNENGIIPKLFDIMKTSMPHAGRTVNDINEHSKLVAWSCYTIINMCANCMPNIVVLQSKK